MRTADFDYTLPEELIAQAPVEPRDAARLLVVRRAESSFAHHYIHELPTLLEAGDLLVGNRSRVLPARIVGRLGGGGRAEVLLLRKLAPARWEVLGRPARRLRVGDAVELAADMRLRVSAAGGEGVREIEVESEAADPDGALLALGSVPLPPYIRGWLGDPERYQTVFADTAGSAAAPTAGLHFTARLIDALAERGVGFETLVLHVGLDTFRPITVNDPRSHRMHSEWYAVPTGLRQRVEATRSCHKRVVAVGTTSVRALESWAQRGAEEGWTDMFIVPGYDFRRVDALLTNFHLPRSTLLMLVSAFAGPDLIRAAYAEAIRERYRFFSFGDAMLIL
jgi:S-adenosylmethionine:tRNA ribosyltransferase-isomerase